MISHSLDETQKIAEEFVKKLEPKNTATVVGLYGNLGAGKTTFTQMIAKIFGISETVTSPTFVIEKIYDLPDQNGLGVKKFTHLIHIDAYRIEKPEELLHLGWQDIISDPKNLIIIEWPERVSDIMPEHIQIHLTALDGQNVRQIEMI